MLNSKRYRGNIEIKYKNNCKTMKWITHIFNQLGINCWLTKHEWVDYTDAKICNRCPAIKLKNKA